MRTTARATMAVAMVAYLGQETKRILTPIKKDGLPCKKCILKRKIEVESISTPDMSPLGHCTNDNIVKDKSGCGYAV